MGIEPLQELADEQSLARVSQAGMIARQEIVLAGDDALTSAQLLAERLTLRLLAANDSQGLPSFLSQLQLISELSGSAVLRDGAIVARSGVDLPWTTIWTNQKTGEMRFLLPSPGDEPLIPGAWAEVADQPRSTVIVTHLLDPIFTQQLTAELNLPVKILNPQTTQISTVEQHAALRRQAPDSGAPSAARIDEPGRYVAIAPIRSCSGDLLGWLRSACQPAAPPTRCSGSAHWRQRSTRCDGICSRSPPI